MAWRLVSSRLCRPRGIRRCPALQQQKHQQQLCGSSSSRRRNFVEGSAAGPQGLSSLHEVEDDDLDDFLPAGLPSAPKPRRKFMGIADLVTEVERRMLTGERQRKDGRTIANLADEKARLRRDNDNIMAEIAGLKQLRASYIQQEDGASIRLPDLENIDAEPTDTTLEILQNVEEVDRKLAAMQYQQVQNIADVGLLKRTMNRIRKRADAYGMMDQAEVCLQSGNLDAAPDMSELVANFRAEFDHATREAEVYSKGVIEVIEKFEHDRRSFFDTRENLDMETDHCRESLVTSLMHMKRMLHNLDRLRDIQVQTVKDIGMMERLRMKIKRRAEINELVRSADHQKLMAEKQRLQEEIIAKRRLIKEWEATANEDVSPTLKRLRELSDTVTPETGRLRETLVASLQTEKETRARLVVLRSLQAQNVRFLAMINRALREGVRETV